MMCPTRTEPNSLPIELDLSAAFSLEHSFGRARLLQLHPQLEQARQSLLTASAGEPRSFAVAQRLISEYHRQRKDSLLGRILLVAKRLRDAVDRMVIVGPTPLISAAQAIFAACGHPRHNELSRGQRGGRPRIYFMPAAPDNDAWQALLEILPQGRPLNTVDDRWGFVALDGGHIADGSQSSGPLLVGLFKALWSALQSTISVEEESQFAVVVGLPDSELIRFAEQIGIPRISDVSDQRVGTSPPPELQSSLADFFHSGVLLAASVCGLDVVKLLKGAAAMWQRFVEAPPGDNPPLDLGGLLCLLQRRGTERFCIRTLTSALTDLAAVLCNNQHDSGLLIQWTVSTPRHDRLHVPMPAGEPMNFRKRKDRPLPDLAAESEQRDRTQRLESGHFTACVKLPTVDEASIGQLLQMHCLAAAVRPLLFQS